MRFVDLSDAQGSLGRFSVPDHVSGYGKIYRLAGAVRVGGNGVVFDAKEMQSIGAPGLPFAVKLLKQLSPARIDRFENEIRIISQLNSPFIVKYFAHGTVSVERQEAPTETRVIPWLSMQLGGRNMREAIEQHGPIPLDRIKTLIPSISGSVQALHAAGFIHRDIKPENFVWFDDAESSLLMIDLGIAKRIGEDVSARPLDAFTQVKEFVGPVFFSSPELIEYSRNKSHPVDFRSDIFQIGKFIWYLATGKISAGVPSKKDCPAGGSLRDIVASAIDDDPDSRPQSVQSIADAVLKI